VTFADEGLKKLLSKGVTGIYAPEQALKMLLADTGAGYRFSSADSVTIQLATVATSAGAKREYRWASGKTF
jgi:hypothetical protein